MGVTERRHHDVGAFCRVGGANPIPSEAVGGIRSNTVRLKNGDSSRSYKNKVLTGP